MHLRGCYITAFTDHPVFETLFADENCKGKTSPAISLGRPGVRVPTCPPLKSIAYGPFG